MIITPTQATLLGMPGTVLFALVLLSALAFFAYTMSRRIQLLTMGAGAPEDRLDRPWARFVHVLTDGLFQRKMFRDPYAGLYHALIFGGFIVLTVRTLGLVFEGLFPQAALPFFPPGFWEGYLLLKDVVLVTTLAGVVLALGRRHVFKKERLDPSFDADLILLPHRVPDGHRPGRGGRALRAAREGGNAGGGGGAAALTAAATFAEAARTAAAENRALGARDLLPF